MREPITKRKFTFIHFSILAFLILIICSWLFIIYQDGASLKGYFSEKNMHFTKKFFKNMIGYENDDIAFLNLDIIRSTFILTLETLKMSIMAITLATIGMFFTVIVASRSYADGRLSLKSTWYGWILYRFIRVLYIFTRAIPELVWAMLIIFILKPGILPGAIALALHNFGILGKLCAEVIEDLDLKPIKHLSSSGASTSQILVYGVLPTAMPKFITYIIYRWEVILRTTIVVGFVGSGGLGQQFRLSMSWFHHTEVTLILIFYITLVFIADRVSEHFRKFIH